MNTGLEALKNRLIFAGGLAQEDRMIRDKLNSLMKALLYSYQACTVVVPDGRRFKALLNPDQKKTSYDNKLLSIPYEHTCLDTQEKELTLIEPGQVFEWQETNTYWIIYLQNLEEDAYFRGEVRHCKYEVKAIDNTYKVYVRGQIETTIPYNIKGNNNWNDINYSLLMYITKNEETLEFFHRFTKVKLNNKNWIVAVMNEYDADGILQVNLNEDYSNTLEDESLLIPEIVPIEPNFTQPYISGPQIVQSLDVIEYTIENDGGTRATEWTVSEGGIIESQSGNTVEILMKSGTTTFITISCLIGADLLELEVKIKGF